MLLKTFIDQVRFHEEFITVILHGGLINYRFSLSRPGGAPKKNPMKLIEPVIDLRPMIGDPRDGFIRQEAFTGGDPGKTEIFNRLLLRTQ